MTEKLNIKQLKPISTDVNLGTSDALLPTQNAVKTYVDTADSDLQTQIDALSGRGRFLSVWNCVTGLPETEPETSPYEYKSGDYYIVGVVSSATPAVNYKPDGTEYVSGVASTTLEISEVSVNDTYLYDGENWVLQSNAQKEVSFSALSGSPYDNTNLGNVLDAKADETNTINGAALSNSETLFYGTSATAGLTAEKKVSIPSITTLKKGVVIFVKPDITATTAGVTLKLNDFTAYPIRYNGAAISTTTDSIVWNQSYISIFVFDGTFWQFAGHGYDKDTTYSDATDIVKGIAKLYNSTGNNTDGSMTQNSITTQLATKQDTLTAGSNITISDNTISATDTTYSNFTGATAGDAGASGLVPAPAAGDQQKFLQGDGTWANPTATTAWGNITGTLSNQTDLQNALNTKQNTLTAGDGIDITSNIISVNNIDCGTMS